MRTNEKGVFSIILIFIVVGLIGIVSWLVFRGSQVQQTHQEVAQPAPSAKVSPTEKPEVLDYTDSSVKKVSAFDITTWKIYEDNEVGLRFNYPSEWGSPARTLDSCTESCSSDNVTPAWFYRVAFPNSQFTVGGASANWAPSRGTNMLYDFKGFVEEGSSETKAYWFSRQKMCETLWLQSCDIETNKVRYTSTLACRGEPGSGFDYERVLLLDVLNGKRLRGVALGGNFIPDDTRTADLISCDADVKKVIDQALKDRKLDSRTMETYDLYNAVFDTVEVY